ncbi:tetratricopeptide repeat protein [Spirochaeta cellobiosiphila]|uniref:tetratricopeptide repeat protein n=1 Tax=Spirochaeta cellobiosiphila TaxID=504483 RepID=UPI00041912E5|nr:tetratricopeptide repeat protein [Spirochaeta cellobiosiphila]
MTKYFTYVLLLALILVSCKTPEPVIDEGMNREIYFQRAQEAYDSGYYDNALFYYEHFLQDFPDDQANGIMARYEIAFISYKRGQLTEAKEKFQAILDEYKENPIAPYPSWPKQLSEKLINEIQEKEFTANQQNQ